MKRSVRLTFAAAVALAAAAPASVSAQAPALTFVNNTSVGSVATAPQGVEIYNDTIFGTGFSNGVIFQITDPAGTPSVASLGTLAPAFPASRGPQDLAIDAGNDTIYVIADDGTNARIYPITTASTTPTIGAAVNSAAVRHTGGTMLGSNLVLGKSNSSTLEAINPATAAQVQISPNAATVPSPGVTGYGAPIRDAVVVNDVIYYTSNAGGSTKLGSFAPSTPGDITAGVFAKIDETLTAGGAPNHLGVTSWTNDTTTFVVVPYNDTVGGQGIAFFDIADLNNPIILRPAELAGEQMSGISIGPIGGVDHLAVASQSGGGTPNDVILFALPSVSVTDWAMY